MNSFKSLCKEFRLNRFNHKEQEGHEEEFKFILYSLCDLRDLRGEQLTDVSKK